MKEEDDGRRTGASRGKRKGEENQFVRETIRGEYIFTRSGPHVRPIKFDKTVNRARRLRAFAYVDIDARNGHVSRRQRSNVSSG